MRHLAPFILLLLVGCDEAANRNEPTEPVTKRYPEFDQMLASARARAIPNKRRYTVTLSNHGEDKLVALVAIRQQWKSVEEVNPPWQEQILPTDEAGVIEVAAGAEYAFEVHPKTFEKVQMVKKASRVNADFFFFFFSDL